MAKKSNKMKIMKLRQSQTEAFLLRSGIPVKDIKQLTRDIQELVEVGGQSMPEAHQEAIAEWKDNSFLEISRKIAIENAKTEAENQKRYNAALKSAARDAKAAARLAKAAEKAEAKAAAKAVKDAAKAKPKPTPPIPPVPPPIPPVPPPIPPVPPPIPPVPPPPVPDAEPDGPTEMPPPIPDEPREKSGIRKAFEASLEEEDRRYLDTLETLRRGAAKTVQDNKELFGTYRNQTLDQSTMYELYEGVVELGEAAAKAKTSEEKQRIFSKLKAYKKIVKNLLIEGNDSEKEVAKELEKIISNIEKQVSTKRFGSETIGLEVGRIKENLIESMRRIPEKLVSKIPIIGGFLSGVLEDLASDISRGTGGRNLFSKTGQDEGMSPAEIEGISTGGSEIDAEVDSPDTTPGTPPTIPPAVTAGLANGQTIQTLKSILIQVVEIKSLIQGQVNTEEGVDDAEAESEAADGRADFMDQLRRLFGGGRRTNKDGAPGAGGEGGEGAGGMLKDLVKSGVKMLGGMVTPLANMASATIAPLVNAASAALPVVAAAAGGLAIGTSVAYGINKLIDLAVGNAPGDGLADYQFRAETYGFGAQKQKQIELATQSNAAAANEEKANTTENKKKRAVDASVDPRSLSDSVLSGAMTPKEASDALDAYQQLNPDDENISHYRKNINIAYTKTTKMAAGSTVQQRKLKTRSEANETETQYAGDIVLGEKETILDASKQKDQTTVVGGVRDPVTGLFKYGGEPQDYRKQLLSMGYINDKSSGKTFQEGAEKEAAVWKAEQATPAATVAGAVAPSAAGTSSAAGVVAPSAAGAVASSAVTGVPLQRTKGGVSGWKNRTLLKKSAGKDDSWTVNKSDTETVKQQFMSGAGLIGQHLGIDFNKDAPPWADAIDAAKSAGESFYPRFDDEVSKWIDVAKPGIMESDSPLSEEIAEDELKEFAEQWTDAYVKATENDTGTVAPSAAATGTIPPSAASTPSAAATGTVAPSAAAGAKPQLLKFVAGPRNAMGDVLGKDGKILASEEYNKKLKELGLSRTNSGNSLEHARSKDVLNWRASQQVSDSGLSAEIAQERADTDIAAQKASQPVAPSAATGAVAPSSTTGAVASSATGAVVPRRSKISSDIDDIRQQVIDAGMDPDKPHMFVGGGFGKSKILMLDDHVTAADPSRQAEADAIAEFRNSMSSKPTTGKIETPTTPNTDVGKQTLQLDKSRTDLENQQLPNTSSGSINTVVAPKTSNSSTVINNNSGGAGTRNNESTLQRAERGSVI
jgi:hypothetical protein